MVISVASVELWGPAELDRLPLMAANDTSRVDPQATRAFAEAVRDAAEELRSQLAALDQQVSDMLGGWQGASGSAYATAWERWHRGAGEVEAGLSMLARLVAAAGATYQGNEAAAAQAMREVGRG
jgi:WXG100 family type VII secretion target